MVTKSLTCNCETGSNLPQDGKRRLRLAMVGAPNAGKSTVFNALTGAKAKMGNWPGTTVEVSRGLLKLHGEEYEVIDFPCTYSLDPLSPDEALTPELVLHADPAEQPDLVIAVIDGSCLARSLYLLAQLVEYQLRLGVIITKHDLATEHGQTIDQAKLAKAIGHLPVVIADPRHGTDLAAVKDLIETVRNNKKVTLRSRPVGDELAVVDDRFIWVDQAVAAAQTTSAERRKKTFTEKFDRFALHPVAGPLLFLLAMWLVFQITTTVAAPLQDALDGLFTGPITTAVTEMFAAVGLADSIFASLVTHGLIAGVGTVLTFAPLMALMFICLSFLEDSGYMARAAVVTDRLMRSIGLPGKAFIPLIVGFGCNVPAISATRVLSKPAQRLLTCLLIPFASCSARLTVFAMLAATFFPAHTGSVVFIMYVISVLLIVLGGLLLRVLLRKTMGMDPLIIDLPVYQIPGLKLISWVTWLRLKGFLQTAGGIIVITVAVVFCLQSLPVNSNYRFGAADLPPAESAYGKVAATIAPAFAPAGYGDWRTTGALITGFLAKEAVISSWAQTYSLEDVTDADAATQATSDLAVAIRQDFNNSSNGHPLAAVWAFMIFLLAYTPCVAMLGAQRREIGTKWMLLGVLIQLSLAWVLSVVTFQLLSLFL